MHGNWDGSTDIMWGGETRHFRLGIGELKRIEAVSERGIFEVMRRLATGGATLTEVRATLKFGLEGGGMGANDVELDLRRYFDAAPKDSALAVAAAIVTNALLTPEGYDPATGKVAGDGTTNQTDGSPSPEYTETP